MNAHAFHRWRTGEDAFRSRDELRALLDNVEAAHALLESIDTTEAPDWWRVHKARSLLDDQAAKIRKDLVNAELRCLIVVGCEP